MKIALSRRRLTVGCLAFLSIAVTNLHADLLYYAGFDDAPGPGTPSGWTDTENGNETDGFYTLGHGISAGSLTYPNLLTTGNKWVLGVNSATGSGAPATPLGNATTVFGDPVATNETIFFSFLLQVADLGPLTVGTSSVISLRTATSSDSEVVAGIGFGRPSGEDGYKLSFHRGHRGYNHADSVKTDDLFSVGETLLIVGSYTRAGSSSKVSFWLNPDPIDLGSLIAPDADYEFSLTSAQARAVDRFHIKPQPTSSTAIPGSFYFDELRFGDTWASVTPVPEPSTYALLGGIGVMIFAVIRRRKANR